MAHTPDQDPRLPEDGAGWPDQPASARPAEGAGSSTSWYADAAGTDAEDAAAPSYGQTPYGQQPAYGQAAPAAQQPAYGQAPYGQQQSYAQPGAYGQPAYAQPAYGQAPGEPSGTGLSIASMVIGILSLIGGFGFVLPPIVGAVLGHMALKREPRGRGFAIAGLATNYLALLFLVLTILFVVFVVGIAGVAASGSGY